LPRPIRRRVPPMTGASGQRILLWLCGLAAVTAAGCADLDILPSWVPFQGPVSDQLPGVVTPAERITELRKLSEASVSATAEEKQRISQQLVESIRIEKDPLIRVEIIRALGRYPGPAADAILKAALSDADTHVRVAACEAWGKRGDDQAVKLLSEALRSDVDADVRLAAAKALGETKTPEAVAALGEALNDADPAMQYRAVLSLEQVTGKDLGTDVNRWRQYLKGEHEPTPSWAERIRHPF
jgi:HEAT repeat protein